MLFFFCKQKTAYEMRISDWSSDVCSSDLRIAGWDAQPLSLALDADGVHAGPINDIAGVFADPQVAARGMSFRPDGDEIDGLASPIVIDGGSMEATADRKSVGEGKSEEVRVDLGGRRSMKKKKTKRVT